MSCLSKDQNSMNTMAKTISIILNVKLMAFIHEKCHLFSMTLPCSGRQDQLCTKQSIDRLGVIQVQQTFSDIL